MQRKGERPIQQIEFECEKVYRKNRFDNFVQAKTSEIENKMHLTTQFFFLSVHSSIVALLYLVFGSVVELT